MKFTGRWKLVESEDSEDFLKMLGRSSIERYAHKHATEEQFLVHFLRNGESAMMKEVILDVKLSVYRRRVFYQTMFRLNNRVQRHDKINDTGLTPCTTKSWWESDGSYTVQWHLKNAVIMNVRRSVTPDGNRTIVDIQCSQRGKTAKVRRLYDKVPLTSKDQEFIMNHPAKQYIQ